MCISHMTGGLENDTYKGMNDYILRPVFDNEVEAVIGRLCIGRMLWQLVYLIR